MPEMLPCTLRMPYSQQNPDFPDDNDADVDSKDEEWEDEDYQRLSDFSSMMANLRMTPV